MRHASAVALRAGRAGKGRGGRPPSGTPRQWGPRGGRGFTLVELPAVSRREGRQAFTLVELMVVVGIISVLVAILAPAVAHAMELARRVKCAANLDGIGTALALYETEHKQYPFVPTNGAGWGVTIGSGRSVNPAGGGAVGRSPSCCLYELVRIKMTSGGLYVCPSAKEQARRESGEYWDFADGVAISYAVMNPYGSGRRFDSAAGADVPLLADSSPYFDPATGLRNEADVVDLNTTDADRIRRGNSPNHRGVGQNVMLAGGSTEWVERADVGCDLDNVYTRAEDAGGTDREGHIPAPGPDASAASQGPAGPTDSYLVQ